MLQVSKPGQVRRIFPGGVRPYHLHLVPQLAITCTSDECQSHERLLVNFGDSSKKRGPSFCKTFDDEDFNWCPLDRFEKDMSIGVTNPVPSVKFEMG